MTSCPHCDHCKKLGRSQTNQSQPSNEIASIQADIDRLASSIHTLNNEHSLLSRRLNALRSSTHNLPPETLSLIFQFAAPPLDITSRSLRLYPEEIYGDEKGHYLPTILSAVCSHWRDVIHGTPQLWTSLVMDVVTRRGVAPKLALLQLYLANVKNLSFSLEINFNGSGLPIDASEGSRYDPEGFSLLAQFRDVIFHPRNAERVKVLRLSSMPPAWSPLELTDWPRLEEIRFGNEIKWIWDYLHKRNIRAYNTPRLNKLIIKNAVFTIPQTMLATNNITVISLFAVPTDHCIELLMLCPDVIEFRAKKTRVARSSDVREWDEERILRRMEILEWSHIENAYNTSFLQHARLPCLRVLAYEVRCSLPESIPNDLAAFFERLPSTLVQLELLGSMKDDTAQFYSAPPREIFQKMTSVRMLTLTQYPPPEIIEILGYLDPKSHPAGLTYLPALQEIHIIDPYEIDDPSLDEQEEEHELETLLRETLWQMLESRWEGFKDGLRLRLPGYLLWEEDVERARGLVGRGLRLEIFEDEVLVRGLYKD